MIQFITGLAIGAAIVFFWALSRISGMSQKCVDCPMFKQVVVMEYRQRRY